MFNAEKVKDELVQWIKDYFEENGPNCSAIIGISGGKDSTVVAALCTEALGKDRVIGVMMPNGHQSDISVSRAVIEYLGIRYLKVNINSAVEDISDSLGNLIYGPDTYKYFAMSNQARINLPPRIRMATLYAISQSVNGRVSNNCNLSEDYVGYVTRWGDGAGDFAPLADLTVTEVKEIGYALGLPAEFIEKIPSDGLCDKTDEDNLGFAYEVLDRYIRTDICEDPEVKNKIDTLHKKNKFKLEPIPKFKFA